MLSASNELRRDTLDTNQQAVSEGCEEIVLTDVPPFSARIFEGGGLRGRLSPLSGMKFSTLGRKVSHQRTTGRDRGRRWMGGHSSLPYHDRFVVETCARNRLVYPSEPQEHSGSRSGHIERSKSWDLSASCIIWKDG